MLTMIVWVSLGLTLLFITGFAFAFVFGQACRLNGLHDDTDTFAFLHDPSHQMTCLTYKQAQLDDYATESVPLTTSHFA